MVCYHGVTLVYSVTVADLDRAYYESRRRRIYTRTLSSRTSNRLNCRDRTIDYDFSLDLGQLNTRYVTNDNKNYF